MLSTKDTMFGISSIGHIVMVVSGKGGVGKSTVTAQLARCFQNHGAKVGVLDADLCGPSIPKILGVHDRRVKEFEGKWIPVYLDEEKKIFPVISLGVMTDSSSDPVVWRGPRKTAVIRSFFDDVLWGHLDVLLIDTPPGTSDEHISICEIISKLNPDGAVIVTTPQGVSLDDVRKEINFCKKLAIPILGVFENMSGYSCPHCDNVTNIFSSDGGKILATEYEVPYLGRLPIDPWLCRCEDLGTDPFVETIASVEEREEKPKEEKDKEDKGDQKTTIAERSLKPMIEFVHKFMTERVQKK